jgi:aspartyl protease family protein
MFRIFLVVIVLMAGSLFAVDMIQGSGFMTAKRTATKQVAQKPPESGTVVITSRNGHYATEARIDGREIDLIVDTGATLVTLRESDAADLGYRPREQDYNVKISTANGEGRAAMVELGTVEVGDITVRDVKAFVLRDDALAVNLLGMSFLSRVRWTQQRGELVLEQ